MSTCKIMINNSSQEQDSNMLFADFINTVTAELAEDSKVISEIVVNGVSIDESAENRFSMMQLGQLGDIRLKVSDTVQLALDALVSAKEFIRQIIPQSKKIGELYDKGEMVVADRAFLELVDNLDSLTELLTSAQYVLKGKVDLTHSNNSSLRVAQVRLVSAVHELLPAKMANDKAHLADVLTKELPDALEEMATLGIPVLQRLKSS